MQLLGSGWRKCITVIFFFIKIGHTLRKYNVERFFSKWRIWLTSFWTTTKSTCIHTRLYRYSEFAWNRCGVVSIITKFKSWTLHDAFSWETLNFFELNRFSRWWAVLSVLLPNICGGCTIGSFNAKLLAGVPTYIHKHTRQTDCSIVTKFSATSVCFVRSSIHNTVIIEYSARHYRLYPLFHQTRKDMDADEPSKTTACLPACPPAGLPCLSVHPRLLVM